MIGLGGAGGSVGKAGRLKTANDANAAWTVNQRGSGNIVDFQAGGVSKFSISAAGVATMTAPTITGGSVIELTAFSLRSSGAAYDLVIATTAIYTADRTLTVNIPTTGNAAITLTGDLIRVGAHSLTLTTSATTNVTLPTTGTLITLAGSEILTNKTLTAPTINGTIATTGLTLPAFTAGGTITMGASEITGTNVLIRGGATNGTVYIIAGTSNSKDSYWSLAGWEHATTPGKIAFFTYNGGAGATARMTFTGALATDVLTWNAVYHVGMKFGLAGTATGAFTMDGLTSGVLTITVPATITDYTLTLPAAANADAGFQLTCAGANTITSWAAAASLRELKDIIGEHSPQDALDKILHTKVYDFHYKEGKGTGDRDTLYTGAMADEAPWAMHYKGGIVNPVNTLGFMVLGIQAHEERIRELEDELKLLKAGRA